MKLSNCYSKTDKYLNNNNLDSCTVSIFTTRIGPYVNGLEVAPKVQSVLILIGNDLLYTALYSLVDHQNYCSIEPK